MNQDLNRKEQEFQHIAQSHRPAVKTDAIWDSIEDRLPKKERKRRPFTWFFFGMVSMVGIFLLYQGVIVSTTSLNEKQGDKQAIQETPKIAENETKLHQDAIETSKTIIENQNKETLKSSKDALAITNSSGLTKVNNINNTKIASSEQSVSYQNKATTNHVESIESESLFIIENDQIDDIATPSTEMRWREDFNTLTTLLNGVIWNENKIDGPFIEPLKIRNWKPYFIGSIGSQWSNSILTTNNDNITSLRRVEISYPSVTADLNLNWMNKSGWILGGGLYYNAITRGITTQFTDIEITENDDVVTIYIDDNGNRTYDYGTTSTQTISTYSARKFRSNQSVGLQLNIGKQLITRGRFHANLQVSILKDLWSRHSGYGYNEEGITSETPEYMQGNEYVRPQIQLVYDLGNLSIGLSPYYTLSRKYLIANDEYKLKNSQYGIQFQLVYRP